jgi:hypothetical protein
MEHMEKLFDIVGVTENTKSLQLQSLPMAPRTTRPRHFAKHCKEKCVCSASPGSAKGGRELAHAVIPPLRPGFELLPMSSNSLTFSTNF